MIFDDLHVLHIYAYSKLKGQPCPLRQFVNSANTIDVSTCMRHIYIFSNSELKDHSLDFDRLIKRLKTPEKYQAPSQFDHLRGEEAYSFLLYWIIGGFNKKNPFNDPHILGDLRRTLTKYENSQSERGQHAWMTHKALAIAIRTDGKRLLDWILRLPDSVTFEEKQTQAFNVCKRCAQLRSNGFLPFIANLDYGCLTDEKLMREHILERLEYMANRANNDYNKMYQRSGSDLNFLFDLGRISLEEKMLQIQNLKKSPFLAFDHLEMEKIVI
ncbi:hypothetical protein [Legionella sp. W05-934-2]|jgi:hypothetical protein|uniref:hypothetical protein n=1 Tax=Legionella sp. W05-934-2 TaxID=1198649 RepID=UPI00346384C9